MKKSNEYIMVLALFIIFTIVFTWPLALHPTSSIPGDYGDPLLNTWILAHDARSFTSTGGLFQGNIMYPGRDVITYSEHLFSMAVLAAPVYWLTGNPILAYNFLLLFGFIFSAFGMYLLLRYLTGNRWAGLAAGVFFAFVPYKISQITHIQICFSAFLPFTLLYLHKFLKEGRTRHLLVFGVFFLAQSLASWHYLVYAALAVLLVVAGKTFLDWRHTGWGKLAKLAAMGLVCVMLVIPFALPYARTHKRFSDFQRPLSETLLYNARIGDYRNVLPESILYGAGNRFVHVAGIGYERVLCPGVCILYLALMALVLRRRDYEGWTEEDAAGESGGEGGGSPPESGSEDGSEADTETAGGDNKQAGRDSAGWPVLAPYLAIMVVSFLLAFGPVIAGHKNYFYTIPYDIGLLKFTRVPARFFIPLSLGLAVLGGIGLDRLIHRVKKVRSWRLDTRALAGAAFCAFLLLEVAVFKLPIPRVAVGDGIPQAYRWLADQGDVRVISLPTELLGPVHVYDRDLAINPPNPAGFFYREGYLIYLSTYHWKDMVNGYSGYFPFSYRRTMTEMQGLPSPRSLDLLEGLSIDYLIWHWEWVPEDKQAYCEEGLAALSDRLESVERFGDQEVFRLKRAGRKAAADALLTDLACPLAVPAGRPWHLGLDVTNPTDPPDVSIDEEFHTLRLSWSGEGGSSFEQEVEFHTPLFVDTGESWTVAMDVPDTPSPGDWRLDARVEGGALDGREFSMSIQVREDLPDSNPPEAPLDAQLGDLEGLQNLTLTQEDGLYATRLVVTNTGQTQWLADSRDKEKIGVVRLAIRFQQGDDIVWEEQRVSLPCDVSPGQTVIMPVLLRVPRDPGHYHLFVGMTDEGFGWFGQVVETDMSVGEVKIGTETEAGSDTSTSTDARVDALAH